MCQGKSHPFQDSNNTSRYNLKCGGTLIHLDKEKYTGWTTFCKFVTFLHSLVKLLFFFQSLQLLYFADCISVSAVSAVCSLFCSLCNCCSLQTVFQPLQLLKFTDCLSVSAVVAVCSLFCSLCSCCRIFLVLIYFQDLPWFQVPGDERTQLPDKGGQQLHLHSRGNTYSSCRQCY